MTYRFFVTGTDTDAGKTCITSSLLIAGNKQNLATLGLKPIASGAIATSEGWRSEDAQLLQSYSSVQVPFETTNPFVFTPPIAPHIAAEQANIALTVDRLIEACSSPWPEAELILIEGAGGWHVPLNATERYSDFVQRLKLPVILVVGMRLGCLNHALLTVSAIAQANVPLAGWVANDLTGDMRVFEQNIATLKQWISAPLLGIAPYQSDMASNPDTALKTISAQMDITQLMRA